jgi:hypothetical protein
MSHSPGVRRITCVWSNESGARRIRVPAQGTSDGDRPPRPRADVILDLVDQDVSVIVASVTHLDDRQRGDQCKQGDTHCLGHVLRAPKTLYMIENVGHPLLDRLKRFEEEAITETHVSVSR